MTTPVAAMAFGLAWTILVVAFIGAVLDGDDDGPGAAGGPA